VAPPPAGSDASPGTAAEPWATLQHAADQVVAGDTVIVHAGEPLAAVPTDIDGIARPQGGGWDLGCQERVATGLIFGDGFEDRAAR
jgi:hypothetical protein